MNVRVGFTAFVAVLVVAPCARPVLAQPVFYDIGPHMRVWSLSADGSTLVGFRDPIFGSFGNTAFRWTPVHGAEFFPNPNDHLDHTYAYAVNHDGTVIGGAIGQSRATRWTQATGWTNVVTSSPFTNAVQVMTPDASVMYGITGATERHLFRWTAATGAVALPQFHGADSVTAISTDGSVIAGDSGQFHFRWTAATGYTPLSGFGAVLAMSGSGTAIYGTSGLPTNSGNAVRWTSATGTVLLPTPAGTTRSECWDVTADDSTAVGGCADNINGPYAVLWRNGQQPIRFTDLLESYGFATPAGWRFWYLQWISDDQMTMGGYGLYNGEIRAFNVVIPTPGMAGWAMPFGILTLCRRGRERGPTLPV